MSRWNLEQKVRQKTKVTVSLMHIWKQVSLITFIKAITSPNRHTPTCQISHFLAHRLTYIDASFAHSCISSEPPLWHLTWLTGDLGHSCTCYIPRRPAVPLTEEAAVPKQPKNCTKAAIIPRNHSTHARSKHWQSVIVFTNPFTTGTNEFFLLQLCDSLGFFSFLNLIRLIFFCLNLLSAALSLIYK